MSLGQVLICIIIIIIKTFRGFRCKNQYNISILKLKLGPTLIVNLFVQKCLGEGSAFCYSLGQEDGKICQKSVIYFVGSPMGFIEPPEMHQQLSEPQRAVDRAVETLWTFMMIKYF